MLTAGWKSVSMVDVHGKVTFTLWLCGCNLECPFCHNWVIAEGKGCTGLDEARLMEDLRESAFLIDYLHITGGEPLLQWRELVPLLRKVKETGVRISLNTNGTLVGPLRKLVDEGLIDHVATDLKSPPFHLYGLPEEVSWKLWGLFLRSLDIITDSSIPLELRIPVPRGFPAGEVLRYIDEALGHLEGHGDFYVVLNPLIGPPMVSPRDEGWCGVHCSPNGELEVIRQHLRRYGVRLVLNRTLSHDNTEKLLSPAKG
ncbi:anaerobic ribonucleoside-triphosphate reductase activating protein [Thermococcus celer]|uniref:Anaerobic ribonucleoside-triphosphate reductase activating protein n=1 Tax=Thermococcus celer Vu 13 = JCM 8558 TaxID=1293037 RepID=A0A218P1I0_THECE|nr:anaerobic ribonucleoside-triphosphate reductase activating protein [Thermococcus celer]ASI98782.1 anaerobic ribonucleoside-triphosphate reductase activating protein [Thermococcus celer Vu 13 = JCM 8558]